MPRTYIEVRAEDLGIPIVDAKDYRTVTVTDGDVVCAKKKDSKHCALARAALRLPDPDHDWRVFFHGPLSDSEYQRHAAGQWVLVSKGMGFA